MQLKALPWRTLQNQSQQSPTPEKVMSLILTFVVIETPLSQAFGFAEIGFEEYAMAMLLAASIIPLMELYKAVMRSVQKNKA